MPSPVVAVPPLLRSLKNLRGIRAAIGRDGCRCERSQHDHQALIDPPRFPRPNARAKRLACPADTQRPSEAPHPPARRYCSHAPVESPRPEPKVPLVPIRAATLRRSWWNSRRRCRVVCFSVPRCQDAPSPCCCPPCVRVQHGCPARCGQRQRRSVLTHRTLYYDIAFGVSGVKTDTPPYSGTLLPLCHVSAERGENFFGKAKILLR